MPGDRDGLGDERRGLPLVLTLDAGGERWTLAGAPVHAGDGLYLLTEGDRSWCRECDGEGRHGEGEDRRECERCHGRGYTFVPLWIGVRFEYVNRGDGTGEALLYVRGPGLGGEDRHAIRVRNGDGLRLRRGGDHAG